MKSRLGVNVDHIATLRNARGEGHPNPISCARQVMNFGANSITCLLYTSDAADEGLGVDLGGRRIIKKNSKVLIVEDVITTGKSSLECARLVKKYKSKVVGYACLINRSSKPSLKIKDKNIVSQIKLEIPTYKKNDLPIGLKKIPITKPGSRYLK